MSPDPPLPGGPCQFFAWVSNSVALLFKTIRNPWGWVIPNVAGRVRLERPLRWLFSPLFVRRSTANLTSIVGRLYKERISNSVRLLYNNQISLAKLLKKILVKQIYMLTLHYFITHWKGRELYKTNKKLSLAWQFAWGKSSCNKSIQLLSVNSQEWESRKQ